MTCMASTHDSTLSYTMSIRTYALYTPRYMLSTMMHRQKSTFRRHTLNTVLPSFLVSQPSLSTFQPGKRRTMEYHMHRLWRVVKCTSYLLDSMRLEVSYT